MEVTVWVSEVSVDVRMTLRYTDTAERWVLSARVCPGHTGVASPTRVGVAQHPEVGRRHSPSAEPPELTLTGRRRATIGGVVHARGERYCWRIRQPVGGQEEL